METGLAAGEPPPSGQRDSQLIPENVAGVVVRPALGNAQPPSGRLPPGSHKSVHAGDWLAGPVGQSPTLAEQDMRRGQKMLRGGSGRVSEVSPGGEIASFV